MQQQHWLTLTIFSILLGFVSEDQTDLIFPGDAQLTPSDGRITEAGGSKVNQYCKP